MPISLETTLQKNDLGTNFEKLGNKKGLYLDYNKKEGWNVQRLNLIKRIIRKVLGLYADTHLEQVVYQLRAEFADQKYPALTKRLFNSWNKAHPTRKIAPQDPLLKDILKPEPEKPEIDLWITHLRGLFSINISSTNTRKIQALRTFLEQKKATGEDLSKLLKTLEKPQESPKLTQQLEAIGKALQIAEFAKIDAEIAKELAGQEARNKLEALKSHLRDLRANTAYPAPIRKKLVAIYNVVQPKPTWDLPAALMARLMELQKSPDLQREVNEIGKELSLNFTKIDAKIEIQKQGQHLEELILQTKAKLAEPQKRIEAITAKLQLLKHWITLNKPDALPADLMTRLAALNESQPLVDLHKELNQIGGLLSLPFASLDKTTAAQVNRKYFDMTSIDKWCKLFSGPAIRITKPDLAKKWKAFGSAIKAKYLDFNVPLPADLEKRVTRPSTNSSELDQIANELGLNLRAI